MIKYPITIVLLISFLFSTFFAQAIENKMSKIDGFHHDNFYTLYTPPLKVPKATILILHGMQEHSGRYNELAPFLQLKGFAVLTYDHLGHGKSVKDENDFGFFQKKKPAQRLIDDAANMAQLLDTLFPTVPHFIIGHSMGSFITRCLLQEKSKKFNGAIIVGTGGKIKGGGMLRSYLSIKNVLTPHAKNKIINHTFSKVNNKKFKKEEDADGTNWLSVRKENRENFKNDPLNGHNFSNNGFYGLLQLQTRATRSSWAKNISKSLPLLFISGEDDPIGNFGKGVLKTVQSLKNDGFLDVQYQLYPNARHEILNEEKRQEVFDPTCAKTTV